MGTTSVGSSGLTVGRADDAGSGLEGAGGGGSGLIAVAVDVESSVDDGLRKPIACRRDVNMRGSSRKDQGST